MRGHLIRRGGTYWFRRRVPAQLVMRLERVELHRSLRTRCAQTASRRARQVWLATEAVFTEMVRNPALQAAQARLLIEQLLSEPVHVSPTATDLADAVLRGDGALTKQLFNRTNVDQILALPPDDGRLILAHMARIADAVETQLATYQRDTEVMRNAVAQHDVQVLKGALAQAQDELAASRVQPMLSTPQDQVALLHISKDDRPARMTRKVHRTPRFSEVEPLYLVERRQKGGGYTAQTLLQVQATFRLWVELGSGPIKVLARREVA